MTAYTKFETLPTEKDNNLEVFINETDRLLRGEQDEFLRGVFNSVVPVRKIAYAALNGNQMYAEELERIKTSENVDVISTDRDNKGKEISFSWRKNNVLVELFVEKSPSDSVGYSERFTISAPGFAYTVDTDYSNDNKPPSIMVHGTKTKQMFNITIPYHENYVYAVTSAGNGYFTARSASELTLKEGEYIHKHDRGIQDYRVVLRNDKVYWYKESTTQEIAKGEEEFVYVENPPFDFEEDSDMNALRIGNDGIIPLSMTQEDVSMRNFISEFDISKEVKHYPVLEA